MKKETKGCLTILALLPVAVVLRAYVLSMLWGWYVVGALGAPSLSLVQAYGLSLTVAVFVEASGHSNKGDSGDDMVETFIARWIVTPILILGMGWAGTCLL